MFKASSSCFCSLCRVEFFEFSVYSRWDWEPYIAYLGCVSDFCFIKKFLSAPTCLIICKYWIVAKMSKVIPISCLKLAKFFCHAKYVHIFSVLPIFGYTIFVVQRERLFSFSSFMVFLLRSWFLKRVLLVFMCAWNHQALSCSNYLKFVISRSHDKVLLLNLLVFMKHSSENTPFRCTYLSHFSFLTIHGALLVWILFLIYKLNHTQVRFYLICLIVNVINHFF